MANSSSSSGPRTKVDLDLDALQPAGKTLRLKGRVYRLPGEMEVTLVNRALQLVEDARKDESDEAGVTLLNNMRDMVMDVMRQENDDVPDDLPWTIESLSRVIALIITGDPEASLDAAVLDTLSPPGYGAAGKGEGEDGGKAPPTKRGGATKARRSPSRKRSRARSSS